MKDPTWELRRWHVMLALKVRHSSAFQVEQVVHFCLLILEGLTGAMWN